MSIFDDEKKMHFSCGLRCAKRKYNREFVNKGTIKFGIPLIWEREGEIYGPGRGDKYEGTFASCHEGDLEHLKDICKKYNIPNESVRIKRYDNKVFYKNERSMRLPVFCLYGVSYNIFDIQPRVGLQKIRGTIPGEYFDAFSDMLSNDDKPVDEDAPSIVCITNLDEFHERLKRALINHGVSENEIIRSAIYYYDYSQYGDEGWVDLDLDPPKELTVKSNEFAYQSEIRYIVNTHDLEILEFLNKKTIDIGNLSDIAKYVEGFFNDGLRMEMSINVERA